MAIAQSFHRAGAHVVATGRRADVLETLAGQLGDRCERVVGDLADPAHLRDILACARRLGGVDVLVNNAGMTQTKKPTVETDLADFNQIVDVNLRATWALSLDVIRDWIARGHHGAIVNVSSPGAQRAHRNNAIYDITKGGMDALTRCLAVDFGEHGYRVSVLMPSRRRRFLIRMFVRSTRRRRAACRCHAMVIRKKRRPRCSFWRPTRPRLSPDRYCPSTAACSPSFEPLHKR
jgi:NAD(P)-dependent dehydrogenase (short-subunit alcohol dehydrogenase family)